MVRMVIALAKAAGALGAAVVQTKHALGRDGGGATGCNRKKGLRRVEKKEGGTAWQDVGFFRRQSTSTPHIHAVPQCVTEPEGNQSKENHENSIVCVQEKGTEIKEKKAK